ncbi:MAG: ArsA family ATPase [Deltaproteobacteria bacterium]|nr:MAG: ArsA family ATPase [Deltaproteobacteria bacterium]
MSDDTTAPAHTPPSAADQPIAELILHRKILVVCGAGGVGKTTTSTALALAAARKGRRVLALTVDPSRRLAQTLGVDRNLDTPVSISPERLAEAGIEPPGSLDAWMLDPKLVADRVVHKLAKDPEQIERLMNNRIYKGLSRMVAGMQEYMAMEALHEFHLEGKYDLVVLDTPPSRNALAFLEGPQRMANFLDGRIFQLFVPAGEGGGGFFRRTAGAVIDRVNSMVFGEESYRDIQEFFQSFSGILTTLNKNAGSMIELLGNPDDVGFLLVTSPTDASVSDAHFFRDRTREMGLPFAGFVLNRSQALAGDRTFPATELLGPEPTAVARSALKKLQVLAEVERSEMERDIHLLATLAEESGDSGFALATPTVPGGANDMPSLIHISERLYHAAPYQV